MKKTIKRAISTMLAVCILTNLCVLSSFAIGRKPVDPPWDGDLKRLSEIYQIPVKVLNTLTPEELEEMAVAPGVSYSGHTEYVKFIENTDGEVIAVPGTFEEYQAEQASLSPMDAGHTNTESGWMQVYIVIIDDPGKIARISATFTWLSEKSRFRMTDVIGISFQNGTYVTGSATGYYTYNPEGGNNKRITLSGFERDDNDFRFIKTSVNTRTDVNCSDELMFMRIKIYKDTGTKAEAARATYAYQKINIDLSVLASVGVSVVGAITTKGSGIAFLPAVEKAVGVLGKYYDVAKSDVSTSLSNF